MKNYLRHFILFLILIAFAFTCNVTAKEFREGQLYHTVLGPPQLATQKPLIELSETEQESSKISINNNVRKVKTFRKKRSFLNDNDENDSDKKKRKEKIKSTSLKQKRDIRRVRRRKKVNFKDKNGDGYDDRHKANDL